MMEYVLKCGCKLWVRPDNSPDIIYCPLHESAPDLYEACKRLIEELREIPMITTSPAIKCGQQAVSKAEGK